MTFHWKPATRVSTPLVFSDLDGTLLDHQSYSFAPALPALARLKTHGVPVIPVTSKTCIELLVLRKAMQNNHPFIVENGAAIYIPRHYFPDETIAQDSNIAVSKIDSQLLVYTLGRPRDYWLEVLSTLNPTLQRLFTGFKSLGDNGIAEHTGLSSERAAHANQRAASEPLLWHGDNDQLDELRQILVQHGGQAIKGGRFLHILDQQASKANAMTWLKALYQQAYPTVSFNSIALGDAENDLSMLEIADFPILVRNQHRPAPDIRHISAARCSEAAGPEGWNQMIMTTLDELLPK